MGKEGSQDIEKKNKDDLKVIEILNIDLPSASFTLDTSKKYKIIIKPERFYFST